ncbi:uncharacterized protein A4U43_C04F9140 [Asparagus officinalis]|uniref:Protein BCCIP homolog n=1 Tax=Asparagus officinalis TaxID=4686 RepID=A0A5P1EZG6_ASPOF|nr:protein BCCIP homolog [Asparagus officinalis]ONK71485.1 uncharacterized protein A4U43_C04F9140 [Asparagus officinalis]
MADSKPPPKRRRQLPEVPTFSSFARCISNTRVSSSHTSPIGSRSKSPEPEPEPKPKPKRIESASSDDDDDADEEEEEGSMEMVQADFGFFDPKPNDFGGVKLLLQNYLDDKIWDLSGFVDLILEQTSVGSVVKLDGYDEGYDDGDGDGDEGDKKDDDDDDGVYAVVSALNLGRYAGHRCIGELKKFLLGSCNGESTKKKLKLLLEEQANEVALLVSQRFVNCPYQLVPPLYEGLFNEVSWATEDEPTQELQDSFRFKFYLLFTRIYEKKSIAKKKAGGKQDCDEPIVYVKAEDEIFRELSSWSFTFPLHAEHLAPRELKNYRTMGLVMAVKADEIPKFQTKLKSLLAES